MSASSAVEAYGSTVCVSSSLVRASCLAGCCPVPWSAPSVAVSVYCTEQDITEEILSQKILLFLKVAIREH